MNEYSQMIVGAQLPMYNGKKVVIVGRVTSISPNGLTFDINTTDNVSVKINLKRPIKDLLDGYIEVFGTVQNKAIICDELAQFPEDSNMNFDAASCNQASQLLQSVGDLWSNGGNDY